jgi:O-antigen ligase
LSPSDAALSHAIRRLPPADRALLELSFRRRISAAEIGKLLDLEDGDVKGRQQDVLARLAADLGDEAGGAEAVKQALSGANPPWPSEAAPAGADESAEATRPKKGVRDIPLLVLPGALTAYLGFHAGGFFAGGVAVAAVVTCAALVLRVTLADNPLAGLSIWGVAAASILLAFAGWVLLSQDWSHAPARALIESDRAFLYALVCLLFATVPRSARGLRVILWGFAVAAAAVCAAGLVSRVLPGVIPTSANVSNERLAYPVTYWNALGMLAALGILACLHLSASEREPRSARILGAAAIPLLAVTLFFTFSRGAIAVVGISLVAYIVLARPRGLPSALLATVPATVVALAVAYGADRLATAHPTAPAAAGQAHHVALVTGIAIVAAALLRAALLWLDVRLVRVRLPARSRRWVAVSGAVMAVVLIVGAALALDAPGRLERQYHRFVSGGSLEGTRDARKRLTDPANNGRLDHWRLALHTFERHRLEGRGAGTYELEWARERPEQFVVIDAHSLYLETLAELGVVGLLLLGTALLILAVVAAVRIRGPDRALHAAIFSMILAWLIHAGIDWDWEMPVITLWLFAIGGAALARPAGEAPRFGSPARVTRVLAGLVALGCAIAPALIYTSQRHLDRSVRSFERADCPGAVDQALAANSAVPMRPEPFEILAYCDVRLGRPELAVRAMEEAVERDPQAWQLRYGLAVVRGAAGRDPRAQARLAVRLNPREPLARDAVRRFRTNDPREWRRRALGARLPID